jgi:hypothetical protein
MRFYEVRVIAGDWRAAKWFTNRSEGWKWAMQVYPSIKEAYDEEQEASSDYPQKLDKGEVISIEPYDIETDKQGLLRFLNSNWPAY